MKTKLIIGSFLAFATIGNSQIYTPSGVIQGASGNSNVGIGVTSPTFKLDITTGATNDGLRITQTTYGAAGLHLNNQTSSGHDWSIFSSGNGNTEGAGNFFISDWSTSKIPFFIDGTFDNVGIGTILPAARLDLLKETTTSNGTYLSPIKGFNSLVRNGASQTNNELIAIEGTSAANDLTSAYSYAIGVSGSGMDAKYNYGGYFTAYATQGNNTGGGNYGIYATYYGTTGGSPSNDWAGYFQGNLNINGAAYCTSSSWTSDQKLKKDIKPLTNGLETIGLLKPSVYNFKEDEEFKYMNLPKGQQLGLIAQELEKVLPDLVTELPENVQKDKKGNTVTIPAHKVVNYIGLIPVLISGMQEQQKTIASLQNQLDQQKQVTDQFTQKSSVATGINSVNGVETGFQMSQNEPNPFTHETVVKYTLPQTISNAFMAVYDLTGKQITTFPIDQKGSSSITITSEKLAAGIYIYSIVADGKVIDSKRMIVADK